MFIRSASPVSAAVALTEDPLLGQTCKTPTSGRRAHSARAAMKAKEVAASLRPSEPCSLPTSLTLPALPTLHSQSHKIHTPQIISCNIHPPISYLNKPFRLPTASSLPDCRCVISSRSHDMTKITGRPSGTRRCEGVSENYSTCHIRKLLESLSLRNLDRRGDFEKQLSSVM